MGGTKSRVTGTDNNDICAIRHNLFLEKILSQGTQSLTINLDMNHRGLAGCKRPGFRGVDDIVGNRGNLRGAIGRWADAVTRRFRLRTC